MAEPEAAVALVHARATDSILLMRRADRVGDAWSGHWSFPGGRSDPADPDPLFTALRELREECGITLTPADLEATLPATVARRRVGRYLLVAPFVFRVPAPLAVLLAPDEAVEALWVPLSTLRDPARHSLHNVPGLAPEILFPAIDLKGMPLWGFTYRLLTEWLDLNPPGRPIERAGFEAATALLDFLLSEGLVLREPWHDHDGAKVAIVDGVIPVPLFLDWVKSPASHIPWMNALEVHPDHIRLAGLAFEEYFIRTPDAPPAE